MKTYKLVIPTWNAAIPDDWKLEIQVDGVFVSAANREWLMIEGTVLRGGGGPEEACLKTMLEHKMVELVPSEEE